MAFLTFTEESGRKPTTLPADKAREVFKVWKGITKGTPKQEAFAKEIKNIYFATKLDSPKPTQTHWSDIDKDLELA